MSDGLTEGRIIAMKAIPATLPADVPTRELVIEERADDREL
jgi:hypothetical protein